MRIIDYMGHEWDYLIVLDACRFDYFVDVIDEFYIDGNFSVVNSGAWFTPMWYEIHWNKPVDVHLVSANAKPFYRIGWDHEGNKKRDLDMPYHKNFKTSVMAWDEGRVDPQTTIDYFLDHKKPGERHLIHFVPPHLPFIGPEGRYFIENLGGGITHRDLAAQKGNLYEKVQRYGDENGWDDLRHYYRENLLTVLDVISSNRDVFLDGRTVITADHGELLGEFGVYNHPFRATITDEMRPFLQYVPWYEVNWT